MLELNLMNVVHTIRFDNSADLRSQSDKMAAGYSKKDFEELTELKRFLHTNVELSFPLSVTKRERPDFELTFEKRNRVVGLELTWAANEAWTEATQHMLKGRKSDLTSVSRNLVEGELIRGRALGERLNKMQDESPVWHSKELARAKAKEVSAAIRKKNELLSSYEEYEHIWLLISDREPFLFIDFCEFKEALAAELEGAQNGFSDVLFLSRFWDRHDRKPGEVLFRILARDSVEIEQVYRGCI